MKINDATQLNELRGQMDRINSQMAALFAERQQVARAIGQWKNANGLPITDPVREEAILRQYAKGDPQTEDFFRQLFRLAKEAEGPGAQEGESR